MFITGQGKPTRAKAVLKGESWLFDDAAMKEDGDGLVTSSSSNPPKAFYDRLKVERLSFAMPHRGMYTRTEVQEKVTGFLRKQGF